MGRVCFTQIFTIMGFFTDLLSFGTGAIAGAGVPIVSGIAGGVNDFINKKEAMSQHQSDLNWNAQQAQLSRDFQREERELTQQWNEEIWNKNNEYNSLASQVARAQEAGVSPNALFGNGAGTVAAQAPRTTPMAGATASSPSTLASTLLTSDAVRKNLEAQAKQAESQANYTDSQKDFYDLTSEVRAKILEEEYENLKKQGNKTVKEIEKMGFDMETVNRMFDRYSKLDEAQINMLEAQTNKLRNETMPYLKNLEKLQSEINLNKENAELIDQKTYESIHNVMYTDTLTEGQEISNELDNIKKQFSDLTGVPLGTQEFELEFYLFRKGELWNLYNKLAIDGLEELAKAPGRVLGGFSLNNFLSKYSGSKGFPLQSVPRQGSIQQPKTAKKKR